MNLVWYDLALAELDVARLNADRAYRDAFAAHEASLRDAPGLVGVFVSQFLQEIGRGVAAHLLVDAHRASVDAEAARRA